MPATAEVVPLGHARVSDDPSYTPSLNPPSDASPWHNLLKEAEDSTRDWENLCASIDKIYADGNRLAAESRDREFQMFWSNTEVLRPAIYARPPTAVVTPRFDDHDPLVLVTAEVVERSTNQMYQFGDIHSCLKSVRDDLVLYARGVAVCRVEKDRLSNQPRVLFEHKDRRDFRHGPARNWREVPWIAIASYLTPGEMKSRFARHSQDAWQNASYDVRSRPNAPDPSSRYSTTDMRQRARVWEIWHKGENRVVWVADGCPKVLDSGPPHYALSSFWPVPRPAYATLTPSTLSPVPDILYYRDQLEEINTLTNRLHALADGLRVRGFYPSGSTEIGDAVRTAMKSLDDREVLVPISNWGAFGQTRDVIVWLPIDVVSQAIKIVVEIRKQVIDDVYQTMGIADIMRGSTNPYETLGAQQMKQQTGSVRTREKQGAIVEIARDLSQIAAEIVAGDFTSEEIFDLAQLPDIATEADLKRETQALVKQAESLVQNVAQNPQALQQAQADPQAAQQMVMQAKAKLDQQLKFIQEKPTKEKIFKLLRNKKLLPLVLDIETDSTVLLDEQREKQQRAEFLGVFAQVLPQVAGLVKEEPGAAKFAAELLRFAIAPFRAGRVLNASLDEFLQKMLEKGATPKPDPEMEKIKAGTQVDMARVENDKQKLALEAKKCQEEYDLKRQELQQNQQIETLKVQTERALAALDAQLKQIEMQFKQQEHQFKLRELDAETQANAQKQALDLQKMAVEMERDRVSAQGEARMQDAQISSMSRRDDIETVRALRETQEPPGV